MILESYLQELFDKKDLITGKMFLVYYDMNYNKHPKSGIVIIFKYGHHTDIYRVLSYKNPGRTPKPSEIDSLILALVPCTSSNSPWLKKSGFFNLEFIDDLKELKTIFKYDLNEEGDVVYVYEPGVDYEEDVLEDKKNISYINFKNGKIFDDVYTKVVVSDKTTILVPKKIDPEKVKIIS